MWTAMSVQTYSAILCLSVGCFRNSQGLQLSMERAIDGLYCGQLRCLSDINNTDTNVSSIVSLTIYDNTKASDPVKLVSASAFAPDPQVEPVKQSVINVTGRVTVNHAELITRFQSPADCLYSSFLCELDFINVNGRPEVIQEIVSLQESEDCGTYPGLMLKQLVLMTAQIKSNSDDNQKQYNELSQQLEQQFQDIVGHISRIEAVLNSSLEKDQTTCLKGVPDGNMRKKFLLWGNIPALCDTITDGGGWVIIQRRIHNDVGFYRDWNQYKLGFGTQETDFWIGLDIIHNLTSQSHTELRVDLIYQGKRYFAHYANFYLANESMNYQMSVSGYDGTAGDSLTQHNDMYFSTNDRDHDNSFASCANAFSGAWWYDTCHLSNLNGLWGIQNSSGMIWNTMSAGTSVSFTEMKIRYA